MGELLLPVDTGHDREVGTVCNVIVGAESVIDSKMSVVSEVEQCTGMEVDTTLIGTEVVLTYLELGNSTTTDQREGGEGKFSSDSSTEEHLRVVDLSECAVVFGRIEISDLGSDVPLAGTGTHPKTESVNVGKVLRVVLVVIVGAVDDADLTRVGLFDRLFHSGEGGLGIGAQANPVLVSGAAGKVNEAEESNTNGLETGHFGSPILPGAILPLGNSSLGLGDRGHHVPRAPLFWGVSPQ